MSDESKEQPKPSRRQVASARGFVRTHGKPSRAVVEPIGRRGARVVLVGADGAMGDVLVESVEVGEALVTTVEDLQKADWDAEIVNAAVIGPAHRRKMGRSLLRG